MHPPLTGLIAAPYTPMLADGALNLDMVDSQAEALQRAGVAGAFIAGSTGEGLSLTLPERMALAERWSAVCGELNVIVHVGHACQRDAVELARHAGRLPVYGVAALAPFYYLPATAADLVEFFVPIANAAESLPFYYYDIPQLTGVRLSTVDFLRQASESIPNLRGVKFTNPDLMLMQECVQFEGGRFDVLFGCDESLLAGLAFGVRGAVGSSYNFAARLYLNIIEAHVSGQGDKARQLQRQSVELIRTIASYGYPAASKRLMSLAGVDCGPVRPPLANVSDDDFQALHRTLESKGLMQWISGPNTEPPTSDVP